MKNQVKKISAFVFLFATLMPVFSTILFLCRQQWVKYEMKERLEEEKLQTLNIPESQVQWVKYKKEIRVEDRLFDIESFDHKNGHLIISGLFDEEETALNNALKESTENQEQENHLLAGLLKTFQAFYPGDANNILTIDAISQVHLPLILQYTSAPFINILTPPPQAATTMQV